MPLTANCSIEPRVVACPAGDLPFHATLRDINHNPTLGSLIIDFSQCTQLSQCTVLPSNYVTAQANGLGEAAISVSMGAGCAGNQIGVHTDTGFLGNRALASPDQDGDLDVDLNDAIILASKVGTNDPTGDLDGDGAISGSCGTTGVPGGGEAGLPVLTLRGLWPNILRADESFTLDFSMPERASLVLELFDVVGRRGGMEVLGMTEPGPHRMEWRVPAGTRPGLYLLRLRSSAGGRSALSLVVR